MQTKPPPTRTSRLGDTTITNPDGSTGYPALGSAYVQNGTVVVDAPTSIGCKMAAKLAVVECLLSLAAYEVQGTDVAKAAAMGETPPPAPRIELRPKSISIEWPEAGVDHAPLKLTVREGDEGMSFEDLGLSGPDFIDDTENKFRPGSILIHENDLRGTIVIEATLATQPARDAVEVALGRLFGMEPNDMRPGRRVALKAYYDVDVRMFLARVPFVTSDTAEGIQSNEYPLLCFLDIDMANVRLVRTPGTFDPAIDTADMPTTP